MGTIANLLYQLNDEAKINWSSNAEKTISGEYPFELDQECAEQFVHRTYLQFLWLPQSIMPLDLLVPSIQRVQAPSTSRYHPLHRLLDDLLMTTSDVTRKYHTELPQILLNGGGAGEIEEMMMWYAVTHEKGETEEPWMDATWRARWLERLERREVQIQILLYCLKLSLPGPIPKVKRKAKRKRSDSPEPENEDYLEAFADKLSVWQLSESLDRVKEHVNTAEKTRDWMQIFHEDVVESQFKASLPEMCDMIRSKVFPHSPFSDTESEASTTRASSPDPSIAGTHTVPLKDSPPSKAKARELARARSRSLSVSLAQESQGRATSVGAAAGPRRRAVIREISMSRAFKPKPKVAAAGQAQTTAAAPAPFKEPEVAAKKERDMGMTLVEETPVKPKAPPGAFGQPAGLARNLSTAFSKKPLFGVGSVGIRIGSSSGGGGGGGGGGLMMGLTGSRAHSTATLGGRADENEDDDNWQIESSPDVQHLTPSRVAPEFEVDGEMDVDGEQPPTPCKPSKAQRGGRR